MTISGVGDEAWQESDTIFVRTGTLWFSLHLVKLDSAPNDLAEHGDPRQDDPGADRELAAVDVGHNGRARTYAGT